MGLGVLFRFWCLTDIHIENHHLKYPARLSRSPNPSRMIALMRLKTAELVLFYTIYNEQPTIRRRHPITPSPYANFSIHVLLYHTFSDFEIFPKFELKNDPGRHVLCRVINDRNAIHIADADA